MRTNLTPAGIHAAIRAAAASKQRVEMNDPATPGLNLRVAPSGRATWTWMGRDADGRVRRFGLGQNPTIGIAVARRIARKLAEEVRAGADPVRDARNRRKRARTGAHCNTLATLLALYGRQQGASVKSWANQMEPQIKRVFRLHLETPLGGLTVGALQLTVDDHPKPKSASFGVRCLITVLRWASASGRQYVTRDLLDLKASAAKPRRDRVLSRDELARVLPALRADVSPCAAGLKLILLTACRRSEASGARWRDVDLAAGSWMLPMTKNGTEHVIPLSRQAIDLTTIPAAHQHGSGGAGHRISHRQGFERLGRRDGARSGRIRHRQLASPRSATHSGDYDGLAGHDPGHHRSRAQSCDDLFASGRYLQQGAVSARSRDSAAAGGRLL